MAASDLTTVAYIVKKLYSGKEPENLASRDRVFLSMVQKSGGFTGSNLTVAVQYGNQQGNSVSFSAAQANATSTKGIQWIVPRTKRYHVGTLDSEAMLACGDDKGAFVRLVKNEMDSSADEMGHKIAIDLYGDGSSAIGQCSNNPADVNGTITLTNPDDVMHFSVGQWIQANPTKTGASGSLRNTTKTAQVTAIDEDAGTVTFTGTITGITTSDWLYNDSDYDGAPRGLAAHFPLTAPSGGDSFFSVDRSVAPQHLAGWRVTTTSNSIEENMQTLAAKIRRAGGRPKTALLSPTNWATLSKNLESKVERSPGGSGEFGFESISMATPAGMIRVYADPECPPDRGYILDMSTLYVKYLGPGLPHIVADDDLRMLRQGTADGVEYRYRCFYQMYCTAPGKNGVFQIS